MIGLIFTFLGGLGTVMMIFTIIETGELIFLPFLLMTGLFLVIGVHFLKRDITTKIAQRKILKNGKACKGTIVDLEQNFSVRINNRPIIKVHIEIENGGKKVAGVFSTTTTSFDKYPVGSEVEVRYLDGDYAWDRKIVAEPTEASLREKGIVKIQKGF